MPKLITKNEWSKKKTDAGSDDLVRDKWHIGKHIEEYQQIAGTDYAKRTEALGEIKRKFGEYKKELISKDKKKACKDLADEIDDIIKGVNTEIAGVAKKKLVAEGSIEAMIEECEEHLTLRKNVLPIVQGVEKKMLGFLEDVKVGTSAAQKGSDQAKQSKAEGDMNTNIMGLSLASRGADEAKAAYKKALELESSVITDSGGDVIASRLDGPIRSHEAKLDGEYVKQYKVESGKHFAEATKVTVRINGLLQDMKTFVAEADLAQEEAEANTLGPVNTKRMESLLQSVQENVGKTQVILDGALEKLQGDVDRLKETLKLTVSNQEKLASIQLKYDKQFLPRVELIKGRQSEIANALKRIKLVPEDISIPQLKQQRALVVEAVKVLANTYKTLLGKVSSVDNSYKSAIQLVS